MSGVLPEVHFLREKGGNIRLRTYVDTNKFTVLRGLIFSRPACYYAVD